MSSYDSQGRLRVVFSSGSTGGSSGISVYNTGSLIASGVTSINISSSFFTTTVTNVNNVVTISIDPRTIVGISGFKHDAAGTDAAYYFASDYNTLSGTNTGIQMIAVLYKVLYYDEPASLVSKYNTTTSQGWRMVSLGYNYAAQSCGYGETSVNDFARRDFGFPGEDKWILAVGCSDASGLYLYINGTSAGSVGPGIGAIVTNVPFMIGANGTSTTSGSANSGAGTVIISAVAINTASYNLFARNQYNFYKACYEAGDIVQDSSMDWHHIWSVKQNPPTSTSWPATVGNLNLLTTGSARLTLITDRYPHWL